MRSRANLLVVVVIVFSFLLSAQESDIQVQKLADNFHNIRVSFMNFDSNILVLEGSDGLLLVDAGYDVTSEEVLKEIISISEKPIKYLINTHAHMDHFGGNARIGTEATLIVHEDARSEITGEYYSLGPNPRFNFPVISFQKELFLNVYDQEIKLYTLKGHTANDVVIEFPDAGIICAGGLIYSHQFPIIDRGRGGDLDDIISSIKYLSENLPEDVVIIPSHGEKYSKADLADHHKMLIATSDIVKKEIESGSSLDEMINADILKDWDDWQGAFVNKDTWITMVYNSLMNIKREMLTSISDPLTETIMRSGADSAKEQYKFLNETKPDDYNFSENEINMLGYNLMYRSMFDDAEKIFKFAIDLFPESSNTYDSMGEFYMTVGKKELAIENYERSLQLNPENTNAEIMIEKMKSD